MINFIKNKKDSKKTRKNPKAILLADISAHILVDRSDNDQYIGQNQYMIKLLTSIATKIVIY